jgi:EAL and modified HD-GYP domain-containing signal transduction protein
VRGNEGNLEVYVARQAILDTNKKTYAYELLFRDGMSQAFADIDGDSATSKVLSSSFFTIGIDRIIGNKKGFINFTEELLLKKVPMMFPREKIMVEILEDVKPELAVISACQEIVRNGYELALDDFFYKPDLEALIALAGIIKIDFRSTPIEAIKNLVHTLGPHKLRFLAEKVETYQEFQQALDLGFEYFQGYFFSRPEILKGRDISPSKMNLLQIIAEANKEDFSFEELEKLITRDVSISYKLMRYINSAYFRRIQEISSVKQAIVLLGEREVKRFISLMAMATLASDKPNELIRASIIRARLCERLGSDRYARFDGSELFTLGLFSLIDAILDDDMAGLMSKLPLSERIKRALVEGTGELADYIDLAASYEKADWAGVTAAASKIGVAEKELSEFYMDAVGWADSLPVS